MNLYCKLYFILVNNNFTFYSCFSRLVHLFAEAREVTPPDWALIGYSSVAALLTPTVLAFDGRRRIKVKLYFHATLYPVKAIVASIASHNSQRGSGI